MLTTIIRLSPSPRTLLFAGVTSVAVPTLVYRRFISSSTVMPSLKDVKAENARYAPGYLPVAVFVGGTSGIGQGMAQAFAKHTNGNAHIVLVGRNEAAASAILASFPTPTSLGTQSTNCRFALPFIFPLCAPSCQEHEPMRSASQHLLQLRSS